MNSLTDLREVVDVVIGVDAHVGGGVRGQPDASRSCRASRSLNRSCVASRKHRGLRDLRRY